MSDILPHAVNFFCSYHRRKNIIQHVKGGKGEYSCHWFYNLLLGCGRVETITKHQFDLAGRMDDKALRYIGLVNDHQQFPAARVHYGAERGETIYMYQQSSSSTAESMNAANKSVRDCTAVDPINAMLLLLKLEAARYSKNKEKAWSWNEVLTPHGKKLSDNVFSKVNPRDYTIKIDAELNKYVCTVSRMTLNYTSTCWFPSSYDEDGSLFGGCSCGVPNTNGIPCHHMCAVVKSYRIDGLNETNVMPIWWHTSHWRKQYPSDSFVSCNTDIQSLCNTA